MSRLDVADVTVSFDGTTVLDDVTMTVGDGEVVALLGPSGSGKSTLLRVIAGIVAPDAGAVLLDGVDVTALPTHKRGIGMVFQDNQLFPHRSTLENVAFGLKMAGVGRGEREATAADMLARVGLAGFGDRPVTDLSGGEAKRVALARTLATRPAVVLLDEPLTGLDRELHDRLTGELRAILLDVGATAIIVTHDRHEASAVAHRSVSLTDLQGDGPHVVALAAEATHDLRRRVLRDGAEVVAFDGDDLDGTFHLGVEEDGRVVAISTWVPHPDGWQLRGMATDADRRGHGFGSMLLRAGIARLRDEGATRLWANARSSALDFYVARGFRALGDDFVTDETGLPHRLVELDLD
ncbi:MAG: GNAT family N-acetyltransferase [Ilumatobacter sp.]|nr:GNAT family N-acetyltransferase [Ilumatobacter sp.]